MMHSLEARAPFSIPGSSRRCEFSPSISFERERKVAAAAGAARMLAPPFRIQEGIRRPAGRVASHGAPGPDGAGALPQPDRRLVSQRGHREDVVRTPVGARRSPSRALELSVLVSVSGPVSPRSAAAEAALGLSAMILFVVYFGVHCFRYPMVGDFGRHCASVASLYRNFLHPLHEAMPVPGTQSEVHTPYIVAVAAFGRALGGTPYRALQLAGVANLVFHAGPRSSSGHFGLRLVGRSSSLLRSLCMRKRLFGGPEKSFASVRWIRPTVVLRRGGAMTAFAIAERFPETWGSHWSGSGFSSGAL